MNPTKLALMLAAGLLFTTASADTASEREALEKQLEGVQQRLQPLVEGMRVSDADMALWIRGGFVAGLINQLNALPEAMRTLNAQVTKPIGYLEDNGNYYLELEDLPNNKASVLLRDIKATWTPEGVLQISTNIAVQGSAKIHGHYKPLKVGGHVGFNVSSVATLNGALLLEQDPVNFVKASLRTDPSSVAFTIASSIKDHKEACWRIEWPWGGEAKDCKTLWSYEIPISYSDRVKFGGNAPTALPMEVRLPKSIRFVSPPDSPVKIDKFLAIEVKPSGFTADARGVSVKAKASFQEVDPATAGSPPGT